MTRRSFRDTTRSQKINALKEFGAEVLFYRLMMRADCYGNFYGTPALVRAECFPLKENVRTADIARWMTELSTPASIDAGEQTSQNPTPLIRMYEAGGKPYLHILNFGQTHTYRKKVFPDPPLEIEVEEEVEIETEVEAEGEKRARKKRGLEQKHSFPQSPFFEKEKFSAALAACDPPYCDADPNHYYDAAVNGSKSNGYKYLDWIAAIQTWIRGDIQKGKFKSKITNNGKSGINHSAGKNTNSAAIIPEGKTFGKW